MNYEKFFRHATKRQATNGHDPYPYQIRLANGDEFPEVLSVPTGVGKTAAVVLAWLYRRRIRKVATPRRLVYCLPMRTLVEQTKAECKKWIDNLAIPNPEEIGIHVLMGGEDDEKWFDCPEKDAILIGTQDMLLSRALNRGYGMSRYQWPIQFALLNNDCLWVLDETQLMGVGLTTSAQLQGLRQKLNTYGKCQSLWMSATLDGERLITVDHPQPASGEWRSEAINDDDRANERIQKLLTAKKPIEQATIRYPSDSKSQKKYPAEIAELIAEKHQPGTLTLVVLNRVDRSQQVYSAVEKKLGKDSAVDLQLVHSRFRPQERRPVQKVVLNDNNTPDAERILITTQAIEAGVDLSSTTLITELASWSSLVQRFGRCNRRGKCGENGSPPAQVYWVDVDTSNPRQASEPALPYLPEELDRARNLISSLTDVGPQSFVGVDTDEPELIVHVIRRKDLIELFDTTPDLSGNDLDVSRYIREGDNTDVQVYWRKWEIGKSNKQRVFPDPDQQFFPAPVQHELCSVSISQFRKFLPALNKKDGTKRLAWAWNPLDKQWEEPRAPRPGQTILLHTTAGGYDEKLGWTGDLKHGPVEPCPPETELTANPAMDQEEQGSTVTIEEHLKDVGEEAEKLESLKNANWDDSIPWKEIIQAAYWHDVGKTHPAFQGAMLKANSELKPDQLWAKSGNQSGYLRYLIRDIEGQIVSERRGYRHELASALAYLQQHDGQPEANLITYLIAAHHGKVRLSIRSMPNENKPSDRRLFARGIWDGDELPAVDIGSNQTSETLKLDLTLMQLGDSVDSNGNVHKSWLSRTLRLRDEFGPFRLAFLETLVRIADWRGSDRGNNS